MKGHPYFIILSILILTAASVGLVLGLSSDNVQTAAQRNPEVAPATTAQVVPAAQTNQIPEIGPVVPGEGEDPEPVVDNENEPVNDDTVITEKVIPGFDVQLFRRLVAMESGKNIVISPLSVRIALTMCYNGASGATREAMAQVLGLQGLGEEALNQHYAGLISSLENLGKDIHIAVANSLWGNIGMDFYPSFLDLCRKYYEAEVASLDLTKQESIDRINTWCNDKTNGLIPTVLDSPLSDQTALCLANAIYLKAKWTAPFDPALTWEEDFHQIGGSIGRIEMMHKGGDFSYRENDRFQAIMLPYGDGSAGMYIILPRENVDYKGLVAGLTEDAWNPDLYSTARGYVALPSFKIVYRKELSNVLGPMGMGPVFSGGLDRIGLFRNWQDLWIDEVIHKTNLRVDEEGTEAAAVTVVTVVGGAAPDPNKPQPFTFTADHPFVLAIVDRANQTPIFLGSVVAPSSPTD